MAEIYCPFESLNTGTTAEPVYDRAITAEMERTFNKLRYTNGVFSSVGSGLAVSANNNMTVTVGTGGAHIEGAMYVNTAPLNLTVEAADASLNRIDRVVLQFNTSVSVRSIRALIRTGTAATNPVAPELRQESNLFEIALADIYVKKGATSIAQSAITDQRLNSALCGFVVAAIPSNVDTTGLFDQYQAALDEWLETVAAALDDTLAGNLQNQITALDTRLTTEEGKIQPIAQGGTGANNAADARENLGLSKYADLNSETLIPSGADLNTYTTPGTYLSQNKTISASLTNCPHTTSGFTLLVMRVASGDYRQILIANGTACLEYTRHFTDAGTFNSWVQMGTTVIKKVYSNSSPTSTFKGQSVTANTAGADFVIITERYSKSAGSSEVFTIVPSMGGYLRALAGAGYSNTGYCSRWVEFTDSKATFGDNYLKQLNNSTAGAVDNTYQIPLAIYTVKGVL